MKTIALFLTALSVLLSTLVIAQSDLETALPEQAPATSENPVLSPITIVGKDVTDFVVIPNDPKNNSNTTGLSVQAVPSNNHCASAIGLTVNGACVTGTTKESGVQSGESFDCQASPDQSVWYKFQATSTDMFVEVERTASSGCYLSSAVYSGGCLPSNSTSLSCEDAASGPNVNIHNLTGLTINNTYLVQVSYKKGQFCGSNNNINTGADFCIRVGTTQNCSSCNNTCGALCIYATQPTVSQVVNSCTAYNLAARINAGESKKQCYTFTAVATSFSLQMIINSTGCSGGNVTSFDWTLYTSSCGSPVQSGNLTNMNATGLSIGTNYTLCYEWTAACLHNSVYPYIVATSPLPVELLHFNGAQQENHISLEWITATEKNNNYFSVQRSINGNDFREIQKVPGAGNSNSMLKYNFKDLKPVPGINYYKLVQYDFDNHTSESNIVAIRFDAKVHFQLLQNPVANEMELDVYSENDINISIDFINNQGQTLSTTQQQVKQGYQRLVVSTQPLPKGTFFIKITYPEGTRWLRVVKI